MPYLHNTFWKAHHDNEPILPPTFDHEHDKNTFEENDDYHLCEDLLDASVMEPNTTKTSSPSTSKISTVEATFTHTNGLMAAKES